MPTSYSYTSDVEERLQKISQELGISRTEIVERLIRALNSFELYQVVKLSCNDESSRGENKTKIVKQKKYIVKF